MPRKKTTSIRVILVGPEHDGNIGAVARAMKNFDLSDLWLVRPLTEPGVTAHAYSANANDILESAHVVPGLQDALKGVELIVGTTAKAGWSTRNVLRTSLDPATLVKRILEDKGKVALLFGRESKGLSKDELELCDLIMTIPASPDYPTLNVAAAAVIVFYELYRTSLDVKARRKVPAEAADLERVEENFAEICRSLNLPKHKSLRARRAFKNLIHRSYVSRREASLLLGVLRRASVRLKTEG